MVAASICTTVVAPIAVFNKAAIIKGKNIPKLALNIEPLKFWVNGSDCKMAPKAPPLPTIAKTPAELVIPVVIYLAILSLSLLGTNVIDKSIPIIRAMSGFPIKSIIYLIDPFPRGKVEISATDFKIINTIIRRIDEKE